MSSARGLFRLYLAGGRVRGRDHRALVVSRAVRSAVRQLRATRRFLRALCVVGCIETLPGTVLVDDPRPRAFCAGYVQRRVYGSTGALSGCTIMVVSFPIFSALAAAPSLQRRRMA